MKTQNDVDIKLNELKQKHREFVDKYNNFIDNYKKYIDGTNTKISYYDINTYSKTITYPLPSI